MKPVTGILRSALGTTVLLSVLGVRGIAQGRQGGVRELLKRIDQEMRRIDELLQRAAATAPAQAHRPGGGRAPAGGRSGLDPEVQKLLENSRRGSQKVVRLIDELLRQASRRGGGGGGSGGGPRPERSRSGGRGRRPQPDDRERVAPQDMHKNGGEPKGPQGNPPDGRELPRGKRPPAQPEGGPSKRGGTGRWGDLPPYLRFLFRKGERPKVPPKYRRYAEEFFKKVDRLKRR